MNLTRYAIEWQENDKWARSLITYPTPEAARKHKKMLGRTYRIIKISNRERVVETHLARRKHL